MKLLVVNGANLNMLGIREPEVYGKGTYKELVELIENHAKEIGADVEVFQSNHEGEIVDRIQRAYFEKIDGIVINPAGYTHTSVVIADALKAVSIPYVEVHISNVNEREAFRQISYVADAALCRICGQGFEGYLQAMDKLVKAE